MIPYNLIASYLAGEADRHQMEELHAWRKESVMNQKIFYELSAAWGCAFMNYATFLKGKDEVLRRILSRARRQHYHILSRIAGVAAAIVVGFLTGYLLKRDTKTPDTVTAVAGKAVLSTMPGQKSEAILPDGTHLWLNSGTTISYPSDYGLSDRIVCLEEGEAFFDVTPDDGKAFRLHTKYGDILVYGTSFDVCSYAEDEKFSVVLEEGAIEIFGEQGTSVTRMVPGQKYLYDAVSKGAKLFSCDAAGESVWRFGELKIERATLETLVHDMECWFGVEITLDNKINDNQLYWMTIKTESLNEMLSLLNMIRPIRYKIDGKYVKITVL